MGISLFVKFSTGALSCNNTTLTRNQPLVGLKTVQFKNSCLRFRTVLACSGYPPGLQVFFLPSPYFVWKRSDICLIDIVQISSLPVRTLTAAFFCASLLKAVNGVMSLALFLRVMFVSSAMSVFMKCLHQCMSPHVQCRRCQFHKCHSPQDEVLGSINSQR